MGPKIVFCMLLSAALFGKPIGQEFLLDIECPAIELIGKGADAETQCKILSADGKSIDKERANVVVRFRLNNNGIAEGRIESVPAINCSAMAAMVNFKMKPDSVNTFVALTDSSKECLARLIGQDQSAGGSPEAQKKE